MPAECVSSLFFRLLRGLVLSLSSTHHLRDVLHFSAASRLCSQSLRTAVFLSKSLRSMFVTADNFALLQISAHRAYGLTNATFSVQGPAVGVKVQNGFWKLGRLGKGNWKRSVPPMPVLISWSRPSLPTTAMVPASEDMSELSGVALPRISMPPVAPARKL